MENDAPSVWLPIALPCRICHDTQYRDTYRTPKYHYILAITPTPRTTILDSSSQCSINADAIKAAYIHLCQGMQYRDGYRTPHCHYISLLPPYPSAHHAGLININTDGLITAYMHQYRDTGPAPSQRQALGYNTNCPVMVILAQCCICTALRWHLRFHMATTSRGGTPDSTLTRHQRRS
jgi:hypothetical protein